MVNDGAVAHAAFSTDANAGIDETIRAECGTGSKRRLRQDDRAWPNGCGGADDYQGPDRHVFSDNGVRRNHGTRMYSRLNIGTMSENMRDFRQTGARCAHDV